MQEIQVELALEPCFSESNRGRTTYSCQSDIKEPRHLFNVSSGLLVLLLGIRVSFSVRWVKRREHGVPGLARVLEEEPGVQEAAHLAPTVAKHWAPRAHPQNDTS